MKFSFILIIPRVFLPISENLFEKCTYEDGNLYNTKKIEDFPFFV